MTQDTDFYQHRTKKLGQHDMFLTCKCRNVMGLQLPSSKLFMLHMKMKNPKNILLVNLFSDQLSYIQIQFIFRNKVHLTPWSPVQGISRDFQKNVMPSTNFFQSVLGKHLHFDSFFFCSLTTKSVLGLHILLTTDSTSSTCSDLEMYL